MEKLLKLINEYEEEWIIFDEVDDEECFVDVHPCTLWTEYNWHLWFNNANKVQFDKWMFDRVAISKEYGFIQWLVENDKIDVNKVKKEFYNNICITEYWDEDRVMWDDNLVIAVLSISDSPIKFLCSILK